MRTVTATAVLRAIRAEVPATVPVDVCQSGGGCATIYVGPLDRNGRAAVAIGPGTYDWGNPGNSRFYPGDLYAGPDDDGEVWPTLCHTAADVARVVREHMCADCGMPASVHASADDCTVLGIDAGLRDGYGCVLVTRHMREV